MRYTQPQSGTAEVDWTNPLLRDADVVLLGSQPQWNPLRTVLAASGVPPQFVSRAGVAGAYSPSAYVSFPEKTPSGGTNPWTIAGVFVPTGSVTDIGIAGTCEEPGSGVRDRTLELDGSGAWNVHAFDGGVIDLASSAIAVAGRADVVVGACDGSTVYCAVGGYSEVSQACDNVGYNDYSAAVFNVGYPSDLSGSCGVALLVRVRRCWTAAERASFQANPWQLFGAKTRRTWPVSSAGSSIATLAIVEAADSLVSSAVEPINANLANAEAADAITSVLQTGLDTRAELTMQSASVISLTILVLAAALAVSEGDDELSAFAARAMFAMFAASEESDEIVSSIALAIDASLAASDANDLMVSLVHVPSGGGADPADVWAYPVEGNLTAADLMRLMAAVLLGKTTIVNLGGGRAHVEFRAADDGAVRVAAEMNGSQRTELTLTP